MMKCTRIVELLQQQAISSTVTVGGWLRSRRDSSGFSFLELHDGSCLASLQIVAQAHLANYDTEIKKLSTGCSLQVSGTVCASPGKGQTIELLAQSVRLLGPADPASYPLQKKRHSFEFLRSIPQFRFRTNALGAVARVRDSLSFAIHQFFREQGFLQVHTPVITTSDCEGAGEMFTVTTLEPEQLQSKHAFAADFFGRRAGLTVSGQLQAEILALSHSRVYTFGPTFRAENSHTTRHLAEFWMLEPEMAFCDLQDNMRMAESMLKYLLQRLLAEQAEDIELFDRFVAPGLLSKLQAVIDHPFVTMRYDEAIEALLSSARDFVFPVAWGMDLQAEHERYLCEELAQAPVILTNYPEKIKPFYMRLDDDGQTVAAMDVLVPGIGELIGGSQREERYEVLEKRMLAAGLDLDQYGWYLDLRRYGSVPHSGFGLGFERLVQFVTGMQNIREVIPFPRTPGHAPC